MVIDNPYLNEYLKIKNKGFEINNRFELVSRYSFAIPDETSLSIISEYSPILEIGAGTGYWGYLLQNRGVDIICYDHKDPSWEKMWKRKWINIKKGDISKISLYPDRTLFLCWGDYGSEFGYRAIKKYKGKYLIVIGEGEDGCTFNNSFFKELNTSWSRVRAYNNPQWFGIHDYLSVYKRNS